MPRIRTTAEREALTRTVLESPASWTLQRVADHVGIHKDTVRRIRYGLMNADVAVDLPRFSPEIMRRSCTRCLHFTYNEIRPHVEGVVVGTCDFEFPESVDLNYARECNSYWPAPAGQR